MKENDTESREGENEAPDRKKETKQKVAMELVELLLSANTGLGRGPHPRPGERGRKL
jgi:hypothetical protein